MRHLQTAPGKTSSPVSALLVLPPPCIERLLMRNECVTAPVMSNFTTVPHERMGVLSALNFRNHLGNRTEVNGQR